MASLEITRDLIHAAITALLGVSQHDTVKLLENLHGRFESGKTQRVDCAFQVLNAYDLYFKYRYLFV